MNEWRYVDMSKRLAAAFVVLALAAGFSAPNGFSDDGGAKLAGKLTLTGSSTVAPLAAEIAKRFEQIHPGVRVDVQSGGSSRGVSDARSGAADLGLVSRALNPDETDLKATT